jgi:hypothetical protein
MKFLNSNILGENATIEMEWKFHENWNKIWMMDEKSETQMAHNEIKQNKNVSGRNRTTI